MKNYKIENFVISASNKKTAVSKFMFQHFETFMCEHHLSKSTLYKKAVLLK